VLTKDTNLAAMYNAQSYPICRGDRPRRQHRSRTARSCRRSCPTRAAKAGRTGIEVGVGRLGRRIDYKPQGASGLLR
jgi:hypothetical protein